MTEISPIEIVAIDGRQVVLKREDLLAHGGGNKVHRYDSLFTRIGRVRRLVALSEPGAHSLRALVHYLVGPDDRQGAESLLLLETRRPLTPYARRLQAQYLDRAGVEVQRGPLWLQLLRLSWYRLVGRFSGTRTVGVGGHVSLRPGVFGEVLSGCRQQLDEAGLNGPAVHVFPIASGQMASGFLDRLHSTRSDDRLAAVTTGPGISRLWLRLRHAFSRRMTLHPARPFDDAGYRALATRFHTRTGVWLDPRHTIQLAALLEDARLPAEATPVLWITCPRVDGLPISCSSSRESAASARR